MSYIKPKLLKGFRDLLPEEAIIQKEFFKVISEVFESFGFSPIDTPALEYYDILTGKGGGENEKLMYRFNDNGGRDVGMRYDLTVPLARFIGLNQNELNFPFRRYHIAPVWRAENTQKGRYREFYQCDCDIVGSDSYLADSEILMLMDSVLNRMDIKDYEIRINDRNILEDLFKLLEIKEDKIISFATLMDKKDKMSESVFKEKSLEFLKDNEKHKQFLDFLSCDSLDSLDEFFKDTKVYENTSIYIRRLKDTFSICKENGKGNNISYCPFIIRGLDYYTGIVFETVLKDSLSYGAVFSGGRYDKLAGMFSKNADYSCVGASIGISRLISALKERGFFEKDKVCVADILIMNMDKRYHGKYINIANVLRDNGLKVEVYLNDDKLKKQFKFASKNGYSFSIIAGEDELANDIVKVKSLKAFEENEMKIDDLVGFFKNTL